MTAPTFVFLDAFLAPLLAPLSRTDVTDLYINTPGEIWLETHHGMERHDAPALNDAALWRLARQVAAASDQGISREHPLLAASLQDGSRIQICAPPATRGHIAVAIRKHTVPDLTLADYHREGAFANVGREVQAQRAIDDDLQAQLAQGDILGFLGSAVRARKSILVSGGTSTGKTTLLNALLKEAPANERLVLIEDTPEVQLTHANGVGLVAVRGRLGEAAVSAADLLEAALRLRPDRIIMGEIRGAEALSFLRAVNTGHAGSISTIHASSTEGAIEQLAMIAAQAGTDLRRAELIAYIRSVIDVIVQLGRTDGKRQVTQILFPVGQAFR
ncbi:MAG: virB11 [Sphingomonadales bacterium]|nr:virB11 [Sphingomonadales bacterium]